MKNIAITIFILLVVAVMALYLVSFQVRETEFALVTTFGKPTSEITEPGWYFKWPAPIQRVVGTSLPGYAHSQAAGQSRYLYHL